MEERRGEDTLVLIKTLLPVFRGIKVAAEAASNAPEPSVIPVSVNSLSIQFDVNYCRDSVSLAVFNRMRLFLSQRPKIKDFNSHIKRGE